MMTSAVATIIQATSPLFGTGADAAAAAADAADADASGAEAVATGAEAAMADAAEAASEAACAKAFCPQARASTLKTKAIRSLFMVCCSCRALEGVLAGLAGADANDLLERRDEALAVTDLAGARRRLNRLDDTVDDGVVDGRLDLHLGQEIDDVLGAAIELGVALLAAEALDFRHCDALHADRAQGLTHFVELERLDDRGHHLHGCTPSKRIWEAGGSISP